MDAILKDFEDLIVPATTHWNHPGFMGYFAVTATGPGILGEMLTAALNANGMLWKTSPALTGLEQVTLAWLREWLGLPDPLFGIIFDTASTGVMHAIAAARECADPATRTEGGARDLVLYTSEHAHSSVEKGAMAIGIGHGAEANKPLARAVVGGLLSSTVLTLIIVPIFYVLFDRLGTWVFGLTRRGQHEDSPRWHKECKENGAPHRNGTVETPVEVRPFTPSPQPKKLEPVLEVRPEAAT